MIDNWQRHWAEEKRLRFGPLVLLVRPRDLGLVELGATSYATLKKLHWCSEGDDNDNNGS